MDQRRFPIPPLIRRNTVLLSLAQAFVGSGTQLQSTLTVLMVQQLFGFTRPLLALAPA